ncbi:MAG: hypothetical protein ACYC7D_14780 [Nitrososphaerales archaeon]
MGEIPVPQDHDVSLLKFLESKLTGSSLQIKENSEASFIIEAEQLLAVKISIDDSSKKVNYTLYSPEWKRSITVEELDGFDFLESKAEEDLKKLNLEANAEDVLLSIDLVRYWAKANGFMMEEQTSI